MTPRAADRELVHIGVRHTVLALDIATGEEIWRGGSIRHGAEQLRREASRQHGAT